MRIGLIQLEISDGKLEDNWQRFFSLFKQAEQADLYLLPELWTTGYDYVSWPQAAQWHAEKTLPALIDLAHERRSWLGGSLIWRREDGALVNRFWLIPPDNTKPQWYDKAHLFASMLEDKYLAAGNVRSRSQIDGFQAALSLCFDLRFPEMYRLDAVDGAELFLVPAQWPHARCSTMRILAQARALENQAFLALCNRVGNASDGTFFCGNSVIVAPDGSLVVDAGEREGIFVGALKRNAVEELRQQFPVLTKRNSSVDGFVSR